MSKVLDILDCKGSKVGEYALPETVIELERGSQAVHDSVVAFMAGERAGTANTKTRAEVRGGGAKPYRQKGTGRARAGSIRSPLWVGGGVVFGPKPKSFAKRINKKVVQLALKRAFSERVVDGDIIVVDAFSLTDHKTKNAIEIFTNLKVSEDTIMLTIPEFEDNIDLATRNIANVALRKSNSVNVYDLLRYGKLVFTKEALDTFVSRLAEER